LGGFEKEERREKSREGKGERGGRRGKKGEYPKNINPKEKPKLQN
jgi:hypothetical protein